MIAIVYRPGYEGQQTLRKVSKAVGGMEGAVPNTYSASCDEVLAALNAWHGRYRREGGLNLPMQGG